MHTGFLIAALPFLGVSTGLFLWAQAQVRRVKFLGQEELDVREAKTGPCKVSGTVVAPAQQLTSPLTGKPCVWFEVLVQELVGSGRHRRWATVLRESSHVRFRLKDRKGPGEIEVDLEGAEVMLHSEGGSDDRALLDQFLTARGKTALLYRGDLRANEATLEHGEKIFVLGTGVEKSPGQLVMAKGPTPFIVSDRDAGQVAYAQNTNMYVTRFAGGLIGILGLYLLRIGFR